ncbi:MAG: hypothetical protein U0840_19990 [Gemmataceae bacterium]
MMQPHESTPQSRQLVYGLLITLAVGVTLGRLAALERLHEPGVHRGDGDARPRPAWPAKRPDPWPTFGSNDRSRWALVRSLAEQGTFVIGRRDPIVVLSSAPALLAANSPVAFAALAQAGYQARITADSGIIFEEGWQSVDKVLHPSELQYYSTKPPLLSTLVAGEYWLLRKLFGWSIVEDRFLVIPVILLTTNVLGLLLYLALLARLAERFGRTDWSRYYVVAAAGFATLFTPFLITFNNHTIATTCVALAVYAVVRIREGGSGLWYLVAGLSAGFATTNEMPALALAVGIGVYLLVVAPGRTLGLYLPTALLPLVALFALNYVELGQLRPAYAEFGTPWYEYEGSHWRVAPGTIKRGIDFVGRNGEPKSVYAFHLLVGHHGWFSLMPVMVLALVGMMIGLSRKNDLPDPASSVAPTSGLPLLCFFTLLLSLVVIAFYIWKSDNYGGWSNGPRWLMWLTPLWLLGLLPVLDRLAPSRVGRGVALVALALSILSMHYQNWSPWRHPWIYNWMEGRGWINY